MRSALALLVVLAALALSRAAGTTLRRLRNRSATLPELARGQQVLIAFAATADAPNAVAWTAANTG